MSDSRWIGLITLVAAALRFSTLDAQSFEYDETFTVMLVEMGLGDMLSTIPDTEATPPLYYLLAWGWSQLFGTGEIGLRFLSALLGTALVPLAYRAAGELITTRVGLVVAALLAVNPYMIWMAQEARSYALLLVLSTLSFLFFVRVLDDRGSRSLLWWTATSALALATHYFAVFMIAAQGAWLLFRVAKRSRVVVAGASLTLVAALLVPLAARQREQVASLGDLDLPSRVGAIPKKFLLGEYASRVDNPVVVGAFVVLIVIGAALLLLQGGSRERDRALLAGAIGTVALGVPIALAFAGFDYITPRNMLAAMVPLAVVPAAGYCGHRGRRVGVIAAGALIAALAAMSIAVFLSPDLQRDDWRSAAESLAPQGPANVVALQPPGGSVPLSVYVGGLEPLDRTGAAVTVLSIMTLTRDAQRTSPPSAAAGFRLIDVEEAPTYTLAKYSSPRPRRVTPAAVREAFAEALPPEMLLRPSRR